MTWQIPWPEFLKKRLCRYLLQHYLGHFFKEKISLEQLSIDIYNGTGCVKDLHLDCDALNEQINASSSSGLNFSCLPIEIVSGFVGYISVSIPWHDLFNDYCKLIIKNVQITIRTKTGTEHGLKNAADIHNLDASFSDNSDSGSMFSSVIIDSIMNTSMHIAQECLGEDKIDESKAPLLGLEAFASTIDSILSRIQISLEQIQIRIEDIETSQPAIDVMKSSAIYQQDLSSNGIALELRIKSIKYFDLDSTNGQDSLSVHSRNSTKNFSIEGLTIYFDEFIIRDEPNESKNMCKSDTSLNSTMGSNTTLNDESVNSPVDECPPFNFDLDPSYYLYTNPIIMLTFSGIQTIKLTVNNMRPTDFILESNSAGNQIASQQRPFLEVWAQFGAFKCLLCPRQIHVLGNMVSKLVDYVNSVEKIKRECMLKKNPRPKKAVRGEENLLNESTIDHCSLFRSSDQAESIMFYSMMPDPVNRQNFEHNNNQKSNKETNDTTEEDLAFTQHLRQNIEQLKNDPIKLTSNHNLFQTFKVTCRQICVTLLHRDPCVSDKNLRHITQRMKKVSDFYFDWSSTIEIQSQTRPECDKYHQASAFNDHFLLILKPVTVSLTQKINQRNKTEQYSLNDLSLSIGCAQLNEYLNTKKVSASSLRGSGAIELSRCAQISELVWFGAEGDMEQACIKAQLTIYEPNRTNKNDNEELLGRSFDHISISLNQIINIELDISIMDRLFYLLNDNGKVFGSGHVTKKNDSNRLRNIEINCDKVVKLSVRFPIADLSRLYQNNIVNSTQFKCAKQTLQMFEMINFRNLRQQILTLHVFDLAFQTLQNKNAAESDTVLSVIASQINAYYQFKKEARPIHFALVQQRIDKPRSLCVQIKIPFHRAETAQHLDPKDDMDSLQYQHNINVKRAMNEAETDHYHQQQQQTNQETEYGPFSSTYTVISSEKNRRIVNAGTKAEMNAFMNQSRLNSQITINVNIGELKFLLSDQYFLNDIYNCFINDLLMFVPSKLPPLESGLYDFDPVNKCFTAPTLSQLIHTDSDFFITSSINLHANFDTDIEMDDHQYFHMCKSAIFKNDDQLSNEDDTNHPEQKYLNKKLKRPKNLLCVCIKIDNSHLKCMVVSDKTNDGIRHGEFDVRAVNFNMCLTNSESFKDNELEQPIEKQLISIYVDKVQLGHANKVSCLKLPSNYSSFDALFQTSVTQVLVEQNDQTVSQELFSSGINDSMPSVSIAIKSKYKPNLNKKELVVALNFNNLCLNHVFTEQNNFWIFQLIDLFNLTDIVVVGYEVPLVVTELHLNVANSSVLYTPVNLNSRALIAFKSLHWSSNVTAESSSTLLVFNIEDIYLFLSPSKADVSDLKKKFVCVANSDLFELRILINEPDERRATKMSLLDIKIRSNLIQFRTCVDSAFCLIELINYIVSDGDIRCWSDDEQTLHNVPSDEQSASYQSLTCPSLACESSSSEAVISDMVKEAMDPMTQSFHVSRDENIFQLDQPFSSAQETRRLYFKKPAEFEEDFYEDNEDDEEENRDEQDLVKDFDIIEVLPGLGEPPRFNQDFEIKHLTSREYEIREDHFKKPLAKIDVLKAPDNYPCPINVFCIQEISLNWLLYAGNDFDTDNLNETTARSRHSSTSSVSSSPKSNTSIISSPNVKYTSNSVQFSKERYCKAGGRIIKKYDNLTWLTRGGQQRNLDTCMEIALHKVFIYLFFFFLYFLAVILSKKINRPSKFVESW